VIDRNIVSLTASSIGNETYLLHNVADFGNQGFFYTNDEADSWIRYDFKDMQIKVSHYSIRSAQTYNGGHLRSWTLEGSKDGSNWVKIDDRENDTSLNSKGAVSTFSVSESVEEGFGMIRLRQIGTNSDGTDYLAVDAIEFFGILEESRQ
jgi:hypothetical protein